MKVAIIPARKNSRRIKNKNIINFCGKPIISWPIAMAKKSKIFDRVIVSTDSKKISNIAIKYGAEIPFLRPKNLSGSQTGIIDVIKHAITSLENKNIKFKFVCCIFATAPFIEKKIIEKAFKLLKKGNYDFVFGAQRVDSKFLRAFYIKNKNLRMLDKSFYETPKKSYPLAYVDSGQFYWGTKKAWKKSKMIFSKKSNFVILDENKFIDVNTHKDLIYTKKIAKKNRHIFKNLNI
jgi:pseudaminic acid cytidylyltransferase|tara:strand:+ start:1114 stop:1818 length:705 start_codon:yes stop_codon:yes gene_type:complete